MEIKFYKGIIDHLKKVVRSCNGQTLKIVLMAKINCGGSPPCVRER